MNAHVRISPEGAVPLPAEVREQRGWAAGTVVEVVAGPDVVTIRGEHAMPAKSGRSNDEVFAAIHARLNYRGPRYDKADWRAAVDEMFRETEVEDRRREGR